MSTPFNTPLPGGLRVASLDSDYRLPEVVVDAFMEDNVPPIGVGEVGFPRAVVLEQGEDTDEVPDNTLIVLLPEDWQG